MPSDYVSLFIDYTREYESPTSFWKWAAYSTIASSLRFNVFLQYKRSKIYPNTYTVLLADSAKYRKGEPMKVSNALLTETKTFTGTASVQGILDKLSQDLPIKGKGITLRGGACLILAEELSSFFVDDPRLIPMLTRMYDFSETFPYDLRSGTIIIKNLCVSMLAGSNETLLREVYTSRANYGGLLRRTLLIKPDEFRPPNSLFNPDKIVDELKDTEHWNELVKVLLQISKMAGRVTLDDCSARFFTTWYEDLYKNYEKYGSKTGVVEGIHTLILKIAMILAVSDSRMTIELKDIERSILEVTALRPNYEIYAMGSGRSEKAGSSAFIFNLFWQAKENTLSKQEILFQYWNEVQAEELDSIIDTFIQANLLMMVHKGNKIYFQMTQKGIDAMTAALNNKGIKP
jgi:hypothetical protein